MVCFGRKRTRGKSIACNWWSVREGMQFYNRQSIQDTSTNTIDFVYTKIAAMEPGLNISVVTNNNINKSQEIPMYPVSSVEIAETTKIVENAHRYLQIAFAEELYLYSQENNINFPELRDALNTKWNVNILEPREGIGGHCLPRHKDVLRIVQINKERNFKSSNGSRSELQKV
jgi:UDP-glucose/GDP-mannose dehydrogenase family protein